MPSPTSAFKQLTHAFLFAGSLIGAASAISAELVLHATQAQETRNLQAFQPGGFAAFFMTGQLAEAPQIVWKVTLPEPGTYRVCILARSQASGVQPRLKLEPSGVSLSSSLLQSSWNRLEIGEAAFAAGETFIRLELGATEQKSGRVDIQAIELTKVKNVELEEAQARLARADASWMRQAGFGVMLHWTRESAPAQGPRKPYAQAVYDLDVESIAVKLKSTGAGFVVLTTAHAYQDFPAPLVALEKALPGRTCRRDLIADFAGSLQRRGLRLMLYHNPGTAQDADWVAASGLNTGNRARYFALWQEMIAEAGARYGDRIAGWWFDDGATRLYPQNAPWPSLHRAARAGHAGRLIGYNSWELPSVTDWQDFDCGEGLREPRGRDGCLQPKGDGIYRSSSRKGQQATGNVTLEDDWLHRHAGQMPSPPTWTEPDLRDFLSRSRQSGLVPIINLKITQEGLMGPASLELIRRAAK